MAISSHKRKLVLHFDINGTIVMSDQVSNKDIEGKLKRIQGRCINQPNKQDLVEKLQWEYRSGKDQDSLYTFDRHKPDQLFHYIVPSFFYMLKKLKEHGRDVSIVIRTFGTDGPAVVEAIKQFASGRHPGFEDFTDDELIDIQTGGHWFLCHEDRKNPKSEIVMRLYNKPLGSNTYGDEDDTYCTSSENIKLNAPVASGVYQIQESKEAGVVRFAGVYQIQELREAEVVRSIESRPLTCIRDDYHHWAAADYMDGWDKAKSGKPLWVTRDVKNFNGAHHIFFDDLVRKQILAVRARPSTEDAFESLGAEEARDFHELFFESCCSASAILHQDYFLRKIARCE
jgi:hypothetical protein